MVPKSPSEHATDLVFDQSRDVMSKLIVDLEKMLSAHADFERWLQRRDTGIEVGKPGNK